MCFRSRKFVSEEARRTQPGAGKLIGAYTVASPEKERKGERERESERQAGSGKCIHLMMSGEQAAAAIGAGSGEFRDFKVRILPSRVAHGKKAN